MLPFQEQQLADNLSVRIFLENTPEHELKWHWDEQDRIIEPVESTNWQFQFDNQLPIPINTKINIPKGLIHRIIKGSGDLKLKVTKL